MEPPKPEPKPLNIWIFAAMSLAVGVVGGFGAVLFRWMIGLVHNLLFLGTLSFQYDAKVHTEPGPWGPWVILVPVVGAVGVAFLVKTFAPEARGHGVPEVMDAIYYARGHIRPVVAAVKSLASALSIGSGGSVGREGPIVQIGSAFGATLGQVVGMPTHQRVNLIAAGAGAGIAATFNTPIGGALFAMELMMTSIRASTILPVFLATAVATWIGRIFLGMSPAFNVPGPAAVDPGPINLMAVPAILAFGLIIGAAAALFVRSIYWCEDLFDRIPGNYYTRHMTGMLVVGVMMYLLLQRTGHYYVQGVGYATIEDVLMGVLSSPGLLMILAALKLLATCLTLGSGASGGVFSPGLFLGAALGGSLGSVIKAIDPSFPIEPAILAVAGMAGMIGGTTGAVGTATIMIFEMTRDMQAVLPILITVGIAYAVRRVLSEPSIYTLKLLRRGHTVPEGLLSALTEAQSASEAMTTTFRTAEIGDRPPLEPGVIVAHEAGEIRGTLRAGGAEAIDASQLDTCFVLVGSRDTLFEVLAALHNADATTAVVMRRRSDRAPSAVVGVLTYDRVARAIAQFAHLYE
jgi:CIC family chloride channel protein